MAMASVNIENSKKKLEMDFIFINSFFWFFFGIFHGHPGFNNPVSTEATWPYPTNLECAQRFFILNSE
jgi:hypothetical protein